MFGKEVNILIYVVNLDVKPKNLSCRSKQCDLLKDGIFLREGDS